MIAAVTADRQDRFCGVHAHMPTEFSEPAVIKDFVDFPEPGAFDAKSQTAQDELKRALEERLGRGDLRRRDDYLDPSQAGLPHAAAGAHGAQTVLGTH